MKLTFGIDLGTTYSCIAYMDENGKPVVLKNSEDQLTTPSAVYFESDSNVLVGESAQESAVMYPDKVVTLIKQHMGEEGYTCYVNDKDLRPEEISAYTLKKLVKDAISTLRSEGKLGDEEPEVSAVITCPAYFGIPERTATKTAGELAGINVRDIINEPTAAAIMYNTISSTQNKTVMVYDLGGGTFDVTIIRMKEKNSVEVLCTGGDNHLGGANWDKVLMAHVAKKAADNLGISIDDIFSQPEIVQELTLAVENAKITLSARDKALIRFNVDGQSARMEVTAKEFESLTADLLQRTLTLTDDVLKEAAKKGCSLTNIDELLLVGGSTKMPQVARVLKEKYGKEPRSFDPNEAVAKGAAVYAQTLDNTKLLPGPEPTIINVSSRSYGVKATDRADLLEKLFLIIYRNSALPAKGQDTFNPMFDNQPSVRFPVMESLGTDRILTLDQGKEIGDAVLELPPNCSKDTPIDVTFTLNESGLLELHAKERTSGREVYAKFEVAGGMSEEEMKAAREQIMHTSVE